MWVVMLRSLLVQAGRRPGEAAGVDRVANLGFEVLIESSTR
jgi:hypothetical protein